MSVPGDDMFQVLGETLSDDLSIDHIRVILDGNGEQAMMRTCGVINIACSPFLQYPA